MVADVTDTATTDQGQGAPGGAADQGQGAPTGPTTPTDQWDPERAKATIQAQRESEKAAKEQLATALAKLKELEDRDLTDQQRTAKELADATAERDRLKADLASRTNAETISEIAGKVGFRNPRIAARLIDAATGTDGTLDSKAVETQLKELLEQNPELGTKRATGADAAAQGRASSGFDMNQLIRKSLGRA